MIDYQNIDCFERMKSMEDNSIDLIVTDPPYGISMKGQTSNTDWDDMTESEYRKLLVDMFSEFQRILKPNGSAWVFCGRTMVPVFFDALKSADCLQLNLENWMTYARQKGRGASHKLKSQAEEVFHISKGNKYMFNKVEYLREVVVPYVKDGKPRGWFLDQTDGLRKRWSGVGNVLCFTSPFYKNRFEPQIHSTQKPFLLWVELIMLTSKPGDIVFDPFAGSCSSGVATCCTDRNFIGCELDPDMYKKSKEWLENFDKSLAREYIESRVKVTLNKGKSKSLF